MFANGATGVDGTDEQGDRGGRLVECDQFDRELEHERPDGVGEVVGAHPREQMSCFVGWKPHQATEELPLGINKCGHHRLSFLVEAVA
ncbi:hypothetical protein [Amycolatopsis sp. NPDC059657]|uniref:hypothetical protein n=1 Tax=Amycolatopsis sp. NPDC059657 TaxID=3346899 RepID=UPI0036716F6C